MKNKKVLGIAALALMALVGTSMAYFTETSDPIDNVFTTGKYDSTIVETFNPQDGEDWVPGVEVTKEVKVENTGTEAMVVRVKFDETWRVSTASDAEVVKTISADDPSIDPATSSNAIMNVYQKNPKDGSIKDDDTVVHKHINTEDWVLGTDGWYYYKEVLDGDNLTTKDENEAETTSPILYSVKLDENADMGVFGPTYDYQIKHANNSVSERKAIPEEYIDSDGNVDMNAFAQSLNMAGSDKLVTYVNSEIDPERSGYSDKGYTLTITSQTVQATYHAVNDTFREKDKENIPFEDLNWKLDHENKEFIDLEKQDQ